MNKLHLYKEILKHAKVFPSKKRDAIVQEIKVLFHANMKESDPTKVEEQISLAVKGLEQLKMYTTLTSSSSTWTVDLEKDPMPSMKS
jgi:hypothetical protein